MAKKKREEKKLIDSLKVPGGIKVFDITE